MKTLVWSLMWFGTAAMANEFTYKDIAKRFPRVAMAEAEVTEARMQGECLVGLKALTFKKQEDFDPVAEWTNYRAISLLEQFPPCQVLIMMEVAQRQLRTSQASSN